MSKETKEQKYLRERNESNEALAKANAEIVVLVEKYRSAEAECNNLRHTFKSMANAITHLIRLPSGSHSSSSPIKMKPELLFLN